MMIWAILLGYGALFTLMTIVWFVAMRKSNAAVVDVAWGAGLLLFALVTASLGGAPTLRTWILAGMIAIWSGRLSLHLLRDRVLSGHGEDARYAEIRARWASSLPLKFFLFFFQSRLFNHLFDKRFIFFFIVMFFFFRNNFFFMEHNKDL